MLDYIFNFEYFCVLQLLDGRLHLRRDNRMDSPRRLVHWRSHYSWGYMAALRSRRSSAFCSNPLAHSNLRCRVTEVPRQSRYVLCTSPVSRQRQTRARLCDIIHLQVPTRTIVCGRQLTRLKHVVCARARRSPQGVGGGAPSDDQRTGRAA